MKKTILLPICVLMFSVAVFAQPQPVGHLTIFSEDGDKFFLILNGERQNNDAQTNLRIEDLNQPYFNAKVIFEDKTLGEISKNYLQIADADGVFMDVTYKIRKNKNNGKMTLNYFSMVPVQQNFRPASNVTVFHYGNPSPVVVAPASTTVVQQTTTTTTGTGTGGAGVNMNVGGINMSVNIVDPLMGETVQTTTTTTTTQSTSGNTTVIRNNTPPPTPTPRGCAGAYPMSGADFSSALNTIKNQSFEDGKLKTAQQVASANCLSTNQITSICQTFGFEESKLTFAKYAFDFCTEQNKYYLINNVFSFSSSSDALNEFVQSRR
jgi:hypothetical protein